MFEIEKNYFLRIENFELSSFEFNGLLGINTIKVFSKNSTIKDSMFSNGVIMQSVAVSPLGIKEWTFTSDGSRKNNSIKLKINNVSYPKNVIVMSIKCVKIKVWSFACKFTKCEFGKYLSKAII
jgi:hypothetical protein